MISGKSDPELLAMLNAAIDDAVDIVTHPDQEVSFFYIEASLAGNMERIY